MFTFEHQNVLYGLLLIPVFWVGYILLQRGQKKVWKKYGRLPMLQKMTPDVSSKMAWLKITLLSLTWLFLTVALANPQLGIQQEKGKRTGIDVMFCFDVSNSMLARDYRPNRLEAAKYAMQTFVSKLKGDRLGIVIFAGNAFVQLPVTSDYAAANMFISNISTQHVYTQGTNLTAALEIAAAGLTPAKNDTLIVEPTSKVIVVISDGEDHSQGAVEVAESIAKEGIKIFTIGIGSRKGEPIPLAKGSSQEVLQRDRDGQIVISKLNEEILKQIAKAGKGEYFYADRTGVGFDMLSAELEKIEKSDIDDVLSYHYQSKFYIPLWIAFVLFVLELLLFNKKMIRLNILDWIKGKKFLILSAFLLIGIAASAQTKDELKFLREGNKQFREAEKLNKTARQLSLYSSEDAQRVRDLQKQSVELFENASQNYLKSGAANENFYKANFNQAAALYRQGKYQDAVKEINKITENSQLDDPTKAQTYYNLGNALMQQQQYEQAIDAYKRSLRCNPTDVEAKYNLAYAQKKLASMRSNSENKQDKQNQQDKQNKDDQNKQGQQDKQNQGQEKQDGQKGQQDGQKDGQKGEQGKQNEQNQSSSGQNRSAQDAFKKALQQGKDGKGEQDKTAETPQDKFKPQPQNSQQQAQAEQYKKAMEAARKELAEKENKQPSPDKPQDKIDKKQEDAAGIEVDTTRPKRDKSDPNIVDFPPKKGTDTSAPRSRPSVGVATNRQLDALQQNEKQTQERVSMQQSKQKQSVRQDKNW